MSPVSRKSTNVVTCSSLVKQLNISVSRAKADMIMRQAIIKNIAVTFITRIF